MEIFIYTIIFIIGAFFGSFCTLAVYRIPLGEDIVYKHSFCPNCKAKLTFKDLIPIVSYIALKGKCSHCGEKIRIRYLLLEILSGLVFLLFALSLKMSFLNMDLNTIIYFSLFILYFVSLFIIAGIDKEKIQVQKSLLVFGIVLSCIYMIYVCIGGFDLQTIYTYIIYLVSIILILIMDIIFMKKKNYENYTMQVLLLSIYMMIFSGTYIFYLTAVLALIGILLVSLNKEKEKIPIAFYLCISNIIIIIAYNFLCNWVIR